MMLLNVIIYSFLIEKKNFLPFLKFPLDFFRWLIFFNFLMSRAIQHLELGHSPKSWRDAVLLSASV